MLAQGFGDVLYENGEDANGEDGEVEDCVEEHEGMSAEAGGRHLAWCHRDLKSGWMHRTAEESFMRFQVVGFSTRIYNA